MADPGFPRPLTLDQKPIITVRNSSCGKVMFLHLSVYHSVQRGGGVCMAGSFVMAGGVYCRGACVAGGMCGGGHAW